MLLKVRDIMGLSKTGIIVDAEAFHKFVDVNHKDSKPVHKCLKKQKLQLMYGDDTQSLNEIKRDRRMFRMIASFMKKGAACHVNSKEIKKSIDNNNGMVNNIKLKSDDTHIISIALGEKKARLLFSVSGGDKKLHEDFKNPKIIKPKGRVYQNCKHLNLLPR